MKKPKFHTAQQVRALICTHRTKPWRLGFRIHDADEIDDIPE
jgi:hypothetical protein